MIFRLWCHDALNNQNIKWNRAENMTNIPHSIIFRNRWSFFSCTLSSSHLHLVKWSRKRNFWADKRKYKKDGVWRNKAKGQLPQWSQYLSMLHFLFIVSRWLIILYLPQCSCALYHYKSYKYLRFAIIMINYFSIHHINVLLSDFTPEQRALVEQSVRRIPSKGLPRKYP